MVAPPSSASRETRRVTSSLWDVEQRLAELDDAGATAELHQATVVHYDRDFDTIAAITGQPVEWVIPAGSVP
jgi:predicted nucleic acid-binding protein